MALVGGFVAERLHRPVMGHAGAFVGPTEQNAKVKARALEDVGVVTTHHPSHFGEGMRQLLKMPSLPRQSVSASSVSSIKTNDCDQTNSRKDQRRFMHSFSRSLTANLRISPLTKQIRNLYMSLDKAPQSLLQDYAVPVSPRKTLPICTYLLGISIDRSKRTPYIAIGKVNDSGEDPWENSQRLLFNIGEFDRGDSLDHFSSIARHLSIDSGKLEAFTQIARSMVKIFENTEAFLVDGRIFEESDGSLAVGKALFGLDDAAYRTANRQKTVHESQGLGPDVLEEVKVEKDGIVYIR